MSDPRYEAGRTIMDRYAEIERRLKLLEAAQHRSLPFDIDAILSDAILPVASANNEGSLPLVSRVDHQHKLLFKPTGNVAPPGGDVGPVDAGVNAGEVTLEAGSGTLFTVAPNQLTITSRTWAYTQKAEPSPTWAGQIWVDTT